MPANSLEHRDRVAEPVECLAERLGLISYMLGLFRGERCRVDAGPFTTVSSWALFASWSDWCKRENVDASTQTAFSRKLTDRGYDKKKDGNGRIVWVGLDLYEVDE